MKHLAVSLAGLAVPALLACTLVSTAAGATGGAPVSVEARTISADEIGAAARGPHAGAGTDRAIGLHVAAQARAGRLVDAKLVRAAAFDDSALTWELGSTVTEARFDRSVSTDVVPGSGATSGEILELDFEAGEDPDAPVADGQSLGLVGAGMGSASYTGGTRLTSGCQTWTVSGRSVTACYQKFKPTTDGSSTRDYYAYNRWATAVGQSSFPFNWYPVVVDIRSRPHMNYASRTVGMTDYFPRDGTQLCNEGSSVDLGVGSLALKIGLTNCADKNPIPNATTKTMGVIYDDCFIFGGPLSKGVEFEMEVFAWQGGLVPILGDYNYGKFCSGVLSNCTGTLGKDGWN